MSFVSVIMLGMAVSFDGFAVGLAFGLRKLQIPLLSLLIICFFSSFSVFLSMKAGALTSSLLSPDTASFLGGLMLVLVGVYITRQALQGSGGAASGQNSRGEKDSRLSLLSGVLREPSLADCDDSGTISAKESVLLGVTLALDALGVGSGAAMMGFSPLACALAVGISKFMFVSAGLSLGRRYAQGSGGERTALFSGMVLIVLGVANLLQRGN